MTDLMSRPRIDPRFAQRWVDARRAEGRRRLRLMVAAGTTAAVLVAGAASVYTPLWRVRHVRTTVDGPIAAAQIVALAGLSHEKLMIDVDAAAIATRMDADPWLGSAHVERSWPATVRLSVAVRSPVAQVPAAAGGWAQVDATGRVLEVQAEAAPGVPTVTGVGRAPAAGEWITASLGPAADPVAAPGGEADLTAASDAPDVPRGAVAALVGLQDLAPSVRAQVRSVSVGATGGLTMVVAPIRAGEGPLAVDLGDGSQLAAKLTALTTLLGDADLSGVSGINLTVPDRPAAVTAG